MLGELERLPSNEGEYERAAPRGRGREKQWTMCINYLEAFEIIRNWKGGATTRSVGVVEEGRPETFMTDWRKKEKARADTRHANEAAQEAKLVGPSVVAFGVTTRQAIAFRQAFNGPARVLSPALKRQ